MRCRALASLPIRHLQVTSSQAPAFDHIPTLTSSILSPRYERPGGQDAKFFTRGKIQVRDYYYVTTTRGTQKFRAELEAAESKDKKFTKRKTVLKKVVANITMGNDSVYFLSASLGLGHSWIASVSPLFTDVVQSLGTPLLEIKKSKIFSSRLYRS